MLDLTDLPPQIVRRLRVFDDPVLSPLVLRNGLAVSTAEELLRAPTPDARQQLAQSAAAEHWTPAVARRQVAAVSCNDSLQAPSPRLASHIRALTEELARIEPGLLSSRARRDLGRLVEVAKSLG